MRRGEHYNPETGPPRESWSPEEVRLLDVCSGEGGNAPGVSSPPPASLGSPLVLGWQTLQEATDHITCKVRFFPQPHQVPPPGGRVDLASSRAGLSLRTREEKNVLHHGNWYPKRAPQCLRGAGNQGTVYAQERGSWCS